LKAVLIERGLIGGNVNNTERIENYPGFPGGIEALDLAAKFKAHAEEFGVTITTADVTGAKREGKVNIIVTDDGEFRGKTMVIATGSSPVKLGCPGEKEFWGRGISSCATCDGPFYKDLTVAVVGGGNAAVEECLHLTRFVKSAHIIHRRDELRAIKIIQERAMAEPKIKFEWNSVVEKIIGDDAVTGVEIKNVKTQEKRILNVDGVFIFIGLKPHSDWLGALVEKDKDGYIIVDRDLRTNVQGIYAAGDVTNKLYRQIAISGGEGARAALVAEKYLIEEWEK
jgi:thioredoxin reductase (NADPH)